MRSEFEPHQKEGHQSGYSLDVQDSAADRECAIHARNGNAEQEVDLELEAQVQHASQQAHR